MISCIVMLIILAYFASPDKNSDPELQIDLHILSNLSELEKAGVIGFTVKDSIVLPSLNRSNLCSLWEIHSFDNNSMTTFCQGSAKCCEFIDFASSSDRWDNDIYLYEEKYGTTKNSRISARIVYVDYSLDYEDIYSDIYYSDKVSIEFLLPEVKKPLSELLLTPEDGAAGLYANIINLYLSFILDLNTSIDKGSVFINGDKFADQDITALNITFNATIKDSAGNDIEAHIEFYDMSGNIEESISFETQTVDETDNIAASYSIKSSDKNKGFKAVSHNIPSGKHKVVIKPANHVIQDITIDDFVADSDVIEFIKMEELNISEHEDLEGYVQAYAIDPTAMNFTTANVTVVAKGATLYKCREWNFTEQECYGSWELFKTGLVPGQEYTFELTPDDPAFGEVNESIYYLFNASDSQYPAYQQMKNESVGTTGYTSAPLDLSVPGVACFPEKWIAPNWTTQTMVNGTWNFSIFGDCSASNPDAFIFAKILKYNGTEYNPFNTTTATSNICAASAFNEWGDNVPYSDDLNLSPGERIGVQFCVNITGAAAKFAYILWENTEYSYVKFPSASLIIDNELPQITLLGPSDNYTTGPTDIDFTFKAVDISVPLNCSIYIDDVLNQTNESTSSDTTTLFTVSGLSVGNHSWFINCTDTEDNSNISETRNFTITAGLPTAQITYPSSGSNISDPTPLITFVLTDDTTADINYTIFVNDTANGQNGTVPNASSTNLTISPALDLSDYTIIVQATDDDGNSVNSTPITITIVPPLVYLVSPENNYADKDGDINFTFYVVDPVHDNLNCSLYINDILNQTNSSTNESINTTFEVSGIVEGANQTWKVECIDSEDTAASNQRTFTVDKTKPSIALNSPDNDHTTNETAVYFNWTATDNIDTILYCNLTIDGVVNMSDYYSPNGSEVSQDVQGFTDGSHSWNVTCWDDATNTNTSETRNFTVDTIAPTINITYPVNGSTYNTLNLTLNWTYTEDYPDKCWYNLNSNATNTTISDCSDLYTNFTAIESAWNNITMWINDTSNNMDEENVTFYAQEQTAPNITNVTITPKYNSIYVSTLNDMHCNYTYNDTQGDPDQSTIAWYTDNVLTSFTGATVQYQNTSLAEQWICEVTPYDGIIYGTPINSSYVEIGTERTNITVSDNATIYTGPVPNNQYTIWAYYTDEDGNAILGAACSISGNPDTALSDGDNDGNYTFTTQWSTTGDKTHTFSCSKINYQTQNNIVRTVTVINHPTELEGYQNATEIDVNEYVNFTANYTDANTSALLTAAACNISFSGYGTFDMNETASVTYEAIVQFNNPGEFTPVVSCSKEYYETANLTMDIINSTDNIYPSVNISLNDTDVIHGVEYVNIDFNASDQFLDSVIANVTYPNGTLLQQLTNQSVDFTFGPDNLTDIGRYNITVFANDTSNNINLSESFFYVNDTANPTINISVNDTEVEYCVESVLIDFNASDSFLDSIIANVTYPNGTLLQQLTNQSVDFEFESANLTALGRYNITVFANDTSGNTNTTASFFYVNDTITPTINISVNDTDVEYGIESVNIDFNASDSCLDSVIANVTYPNGTLLQQLTNQSVDFEFEPANFTVLGRYNITVFANDTADLTNTTTSYFNVNDTIYPTINISVNDTDVLHSLESIQIDFNASDYLLDSIIANVTYPNGSLLQQLTNQSVDFIFEPDNLTAVGQYNITVFANDTSNNINLSESFFYVNDTIYPTINISVNDTYVEHGVESVKIDFNASDTFLDSVIANVTYPNGTLLQQLTNQATDFVFVPANLTELGWYNITVVANDTSGNTNTSTSSFEVFEYKWYDNRTDPSGIVYYFPDADYQFNVSWNLTIDTVYFEHNFTGTLQNYTATGNLSQEFYYNDSNIQPGSYVWRSLANDTSGAWYSTDSRGGDYWDYDVLAFDDYTLNGTILDNEGNFMNASFNIYNSTGDLVYSSNESFDFDFSGTEKYDLQVTSIYDPNINHFWIKGLFNNSDITDAIIGTHNMSMTLTVIDTTLLNYDSLVIEKKPVSSANGIFFKCDGDYNLSTYTCSGTWRPWFNIKSVDYDNYTFSPGDPALIEGNGTFFEDFETGTFATNNWTSGGATNNWAIASDSPYAGIYNAEAENTDGESILETNVSTASYINITFSFYANTVGLDGGEYVAADWYNSTNWIEVLNVEDIADYTLYEFNLSSDADNNADFKIRFRCNSSSPNEICQIDNVYVDGTLVDLINPTINISVNATDVEYSIESVKIDFNASDEISLDSVIANVTYPNGTLLQQLTDHNVDFIFVPANLTSIGRYNITVFANDTSGNTNTSTDFFYVNDTIAPTTNISVNDTDVEYSIESVLIDFNASNGLLDSVIANVTYPNGTLLQQLTDQSVDFIFGPDNLTALGRYNITVFANDTSGNTNTSTNFFYVNDTINPVINIFVNDTDLEYGYESVKIDFNASDALLDAVIANVTYPNGTILQQLTDQAVDFILGPENLTALGRYNITIFANDTFGNTNTSTDFFYVNDTAAPTINISVNDTDVEYGYESVKIDFNASNGNIDSVIANVTYPNGTLIQQLTDQSVDFIFGPDNLTALGRYNITVFANDTSNNINISESFFYVNDTIAPTINISVNDTEVEYSIESMLIDFNASNGLLDSVIANVTYPNGTLLQQLTDQAVDFILGPDNLTALGRYNITIFANDTSGNTNTTTSFFYVNDTIAPTINISVNDTEVEYSIESVLIDFNTSNGLLDSVIANVTYPNGTLLQQLTDQSIDFIFEPANLTSIGRYNITVFANDTSGNTNTSTDFFYVNDTIAPTTNISVNNTDVEYDIESVLIDFNASNGLLDSVIANVTYPNGTLLQQLTDQSIDLVFAPANLTALGRYNITVFANDTSGNTNTSESFFYVNDTVAPIINISVNDTDVEYSIESVLIDFNASNGLLDSVIANVTYPDGIPLQQLTDQSIDFVFVPANLISTGRYNITVFANDTSGNTNTSTSYFYVNDTLVPEINISVNDTHIQNGTESVRIDFNASDINLDSVIANVTYPNGTLLQQLTNQSIDFEFDPTNLTELGQYNITVFANDTYGNTNISTSYFQVITGPTITISVNDTSVEFGIEYVLIDFNASTNATIDTIIANVTYPNGTLLQQLTNQSVDFIFGPANLTVLGTYDITVFANDTEGNPNTETSFFDVDDTTPPAWDQTPQNQVIEYNDSFSYDVNASDNYQKDIYFINDSSNFAITSDTGLITNATSFTQGILYLNISVNDTSNNINSTVIQITVQDSTGPVLNIIYPVNSSTYYSLNLTLNWTFTEDYPDKCWYNLNNNATNSSIADCSDLYANFTAASLAWNNITMWINDTSNNIATESITFYARTQTAPNVTNVTITPVYNGANVSTLNNMHCNYTYNDIEGDPDQSTIKWFKNGALTSFTSATISYQNTSIGEQWLCEVTPYDGINYSALINSSAVEINVEPASLVVSDNATIYAGPAPNNNYIIWAYYTDEENNYILDASCSITGSPASVLPDSPVADGNYSKNFNWTVLGNKVHTFNCSKQDYQTIDNISRTVTVINHPTNVVGEENTSTIELGDSVLVTANYTDTDTNISLSGADCDVDIPGMGTYNMTETNVSTYEVVILFNQTGEYSPQIICSKEYYTGGNVFINTINTSDTTPPDITLIDPVNGTYNGNITFSFNASDISNEIYSCLVYLNSTFNVSNQSSVVTNGTNYINLTDRQNETFLWHIECADANNNTGYSDNRTISIDNLDPTVILSSPPNATNTSNNSIDFICNATDNMVDIVNITLYHNIGGSFAPNETKSVSGLSNSSTFSLISLPDGTYIWNCLAYDLADDNLSNSAFAANNYSITIDSSKPDINISVNDTDAEYGIESVKIDFNASDANLDEVIANVNYPNGTLLQQLTNQATDFIFNSSNLTEIGRYNITVFANDTFGNTNTSESFFNVVDTIFPTWNQTPSSQTIEYNTDFSYQVNASDNYQIDKYFIDDTSNFIINPATGLITNNTLLDLGIYSLNISVNDTSNNIKSEVISITVNDTINPTWDQAPDNQSIEAGTVFNYDINASDNYQIDKYFLNDTNNFAINADTGIITNNTVLDLGIYYLNISVNDTSNNINSSLIDITVNDTTNPAWDQTPANQVAEYGTAFSYEVNASDYLVDKYFIDDNTNFTINSASGLITNNTLLDLGIYSLNISVNDTSNNINSSVINVTVQDTTAPAINISVNDTDLLFGNESVRIDFNASDYFLDSVIASVTDPNGTLLQQLTNQSFDFTFGPDNLTELGDYTITVFANDTTGSSNTATTTFSVSTVAVRAGGGPLHVIYTIVPKEREPIYIPVKELPPVEKKIPPEEIPPVEELPEVEEEVPVMIGIPGPPRVEKPSILVPLGFTLLEAVLLFSALALFIWYKSFRRKSL